MLKKICHGNKGNFAMAIKVNLPWVRKRKFEMAKYK